MKSPEQIDESVRNLILGLLATASTAASINTIINKLVASPDPIESKIQAIETAKEISKNGEFEKTMDSVLLAIKQSDSPILVKPNIKYSTKDVDINEYSRYIIPSEIYGNDLKDPSNKRFLKPYKDDVGLWTIGIGHLIGKGSHEDMISFVSKNGNTITIEQLLQLFNKDVQKHVDIAKNKFGSQWEEFSPNLKMALVDISFRGDLLNSKGTKDFDFVNKIKGRKFKDAATSYLDHKEYKERSGRGGKDGVVTRMNKNAKNIANEKFSPTVVKN